MLLIGSPLYCSGENATKSAVWVLGSGSAVLFAVVFINLRFSRNPAAGLTVLARGCVNVAVINLSGPGLVLGENDQAGSWSHLNALHCIVERYNEVVFYPWSPQFIPLTYLLD
jgi:hypothetical protein